MSRANVHKNSWLCAVFPLLAGSNIKIHILQRSSVSDFSMNKHGQHPIKTRVFVSPYWHSHHLQSKSSHLHMRGCPTRVKMFGNYYYKSGTEQGP